MSAERGTASPLAAVEFEARPSMAAQVHAYLKRALLTLQLRPGEPLSEKELSVRLGVSRTPVREALIKLADEGLVDILPQRGTFVAPIRVSEVAEAQFVREALEVAVVRRVAQEATPELVRALEDNLAQQAEAIRAQDLELFMRLDEALHRRLSDEVRLARAWKVIQSVKGQLDRVRYLSLPEPGHLALLQVQHAAIVEAIAARDVERAGEAMRTHLNEVFGSVRVLMRSRPEFFL